MNYFITEIGNFKSQKFTVENERKETIKCALFDPEQWDLL